MKNRKRVVLWILAILAGLSGAGSGRAQSFAAGVTNGIVASFQIAEASGLIASRQNPGVLWTHNDSGTPGTVFALATNGMSLGGYHVPEAPFGDYEDISFGPGPVPGFQYIYLGDIGDNFSSRAYIRIYRFPEPAISLSQSNNPLFREVPIYEEIDLTYPDGPHNCEAMVVDPVTADLFLATKGTNSSGIYRLARAAFVTGTTAELEFVREIPYKSLSAGDISADGSLIVFRRSGRADLWKRKAGQSVGDALAGTPTQVPVIGQPVEPNGEAIAFHPTGLGYYTLSEGFSQPIYYFRRTDSGIPHQPTVFIASGESWKYDDSGADRGTNWSRMTFDDQAWNEGPGPFGYGEGDETTALWFGSDTQKTITTYFRKTFQVGSTNGLSFVALRSIFNDGLAIYLNGSPIVRRNLQANAAFGDLATADASAGQNLWQSFPINPGLLRKGTNVLAAEIHRFDPSGPTLSFDLQLLEGRVDKALQFSSPPRLTNRVATLNILGPNGFQITIGMSTNMVDWRNLYQATLTNGVGRVRETNSLGTGPRFYRLE